MKATSRGQKRLKYLGDDLEDELESQEEATASPGSEGRKIKEGGQRKRARKGSQVILTSTSPNS